MFQIVGREVGLATVFDFAPTTFHGIQLRAIWRQIFKPKPRGMPDRKILGRLEMRPKVVPDKDDSMTKTMMQFAEKGNQK
jgi:hypothetical protein